MLTETNVIREYIDQVYPDIPLYPGHGFEKAKIRGMVKMIELYLDLAARRCHAEEFFGQAVEELTKKVKRALYRGIEGIVSTAKPTPLFSW